MALLSACTVSSREYLPFARVLAGCLARYQPSTKLFVLLTYDPDHEIDAAGEPFEVLWNDEIGVDATELHRMYLMQGRHFMAAVKPFLLRHLVRSTGGPVLYIDSDICLYDSIEDLGELIERDGVLLSPHSLGPFPQDGLLPDDTMILSAGTFNAGFIGVGQRGLPMLEFLESRLRRECVIEPQRMRFNEQRWLDLLPSYWPCHVLRDPGINAAYWNLHDRPLTRVGTERFVGGAKLRAFHFSGHFLDRPEVVSTYLADRGRITFASEPLLVDLFAEYRAAVRAAGWTPAVDVPEPFGELPGGIPVDATLRDLYRRSVVASESLGIEPPPDGYDAAQRPLFLAWTELTYRAADIPAPAWARGSLASRAGHTPSSPPHATAPRVMVETPVAATEAPGGPVVDAVELVQRLASSTSAALANLNQRLGELERTVGPPRS